MKKDKKNRIMVSTDFISDNQSDEWYKYKIVCGTALDILIPEDFQYLFFGKYWVDPASVNLEVGVHYVGMRMVDKDDILGYGAGYLFDPKYEDYIAKTEEWVNIESQDRMTLYPGLYMRLEMFHTTDTTVEALIQLGFGKEE